MFFFEGKKLDLLINTAFLQFIFVIFALEYKVWTTGLDQVIKKKLFSQIIRHKIF